MKKFILGVIVLLISLIMVSCEATSKGIFIDDDKQDIVLEKYGEVEYINEGIVIYKNLKHIFNDVEGMDYIVEHSGDWGSIHPELFENFYVLVDVVKHEGIYKLLIYDILMKDNADKSKMFIITDYVLPIKIENILSYMDSNELEQDIKDFSINFLKKDHSLEFNLTNIDELSMTYYNRSMEGHIFMSFHDRKTGHTIVGTPYDVVFGNVKEKILYMPSTVTYEDYTYTNFNTLEDTAIPFSLDGGTNFNTVDGRLETFDIWSEAIDSHISSMIFFVAWSYDEFLEEIELAKNNEMYRYTHNYLDDEGANQLIEMYDETYFEDNILIFYYKFEGNISENYVYSVTKTSDKLYVNVNRFAGMETAESSWLEVITIKKSDIKDIEAVHVIVRTVAPLQASLIYYIQEDYIRDFYIYGKTKEDFVELDNLKDIRTFTWSLNVDLIFGKNVSDEALNEVISVLEANPHIKSMGYRGKDFIRIQMDNKFYDQVINKTLVIKDFIKDDVFIETYDFTISILNFIPIGYIEFYLDNKGKEEAYQMKIDLEQSAYPFLRKFEEGTPGN